MISKIKPFGSAEEDLTDTLGTSLKTVLTVVVSIRVGFVISVLAYVLPLGQRLPVISKLSSTDK
jgi:hypothetical protein